MIKIRGARKAYDSQAGPIVALDNINLDIPRGYFTAIMGPSGCGKSTLLNIIGGLDKPSAGEIEVDGQRIENLPERTLTNYRRHVVGIIFQFYNLLPTLSVLENIVLPALLAGRNERAATVQACRLAERVGLSFRLDHHPHQLSGGEMQRAAIARAMINDPPVVLADEPTGNLDSRAASEVLDILSVLSLERGATVVMVTHSQEAANVAGRIVYMRDGRIEEVYAPVAAG